MKHCYIFSAAQGEPVNFTPKEEDLIIAADAGFLKLKKLGVTPHLTVGDFDSLGEIPKNCEIIKHPTRKNDTDTLLAVKIGLERGFKSFKLYGCAGKRLDHTLANLQTLCFIASRGGRGYLYGEDFIATALKDDCLELPQENSGNISVFAADSECVISLSGLLYTLEKQKLTSDFPLGVSNEFTGQPSRITLHEGTAIIIWDRKKASE